MRVPLIVLIVIFAVSVLGLSLIPGQDAQGRPDRMGIFDSFYFMSYTATTIGFGELPNAFTAAQRMWVTLTIFLSVIGWAYAIGSLLSLMQDQGFRQALARRSFTQSVRRMREPFLLLVGYGNASKMLARSLDDMGRRFVVIDNQDTRVSAVELDSYRADAPALLGDARDTGLLTLAGLGHAHLRGGGRAGRRRRDQPRRRDDHGPAPPRPAGDRPVQLAGRRRADARLPRAARW